MPTDARYRIRPAAEADLPEIARIERQLFSDPWAPGAFSGLLGPFAYVAVLEPEVVGYLFAYRVLDEAEILNLAVDSQHQRVGIGRELVARGLSELGAVGVRRAYLEVRESNQPAQAFYRHFGFHTVGRRRGYYARPREDALVLALDIPPK